MMMTRRRITLVVDEDQWGGSFVRTLLDYGDRTGLTVESVEDVPIVQTFTVTMTHPTGCPPITMDTFRLALVRRWPDHTITIIEAE